MKWFSIEGIRTEIKRIRWPKGDEFKESITDTLAFSVAMGVFFVLSDTIIAVFIRFIGAQ